MASVLIRVKVFDKDTRRSYQGAYVEIGGYSNLATYTDADGNAAISYPYDTGVVTVYVNGQEVWSDYVSKLPRTIIAEVPYRY